MMKGEAHSSWMSKEFNLTTEMKIKTIILRAYFYQSDWLKSKAHQYMYWQDRGKTGPVTLAGGRINWYSIFGEIIWWYCIEINAYILLNQQRCKSFSNSCFCHMFMFQILNHVTWLPTQKWTMKTYERVSNILMSWSLQKKKNI